jgi:hypothetical protein
MSNFLKAINFLKADPEKRFLVIVDEHSRTVGAERTTLNDIPREDLQAYLKLHLGKQDQDLLVWIEARQKVGITDKKTGSFPVKIDAEVKPVQAQVQAPAPAQHYDQQPTNYLGQAVQSQSNNVTIPSHVFLEMQRKADRLDDATEKIVELRNDLQKVTTNRDALDIDNRDLKTKLSTAEAQKDLAVQLAKTENKSFLESDAFAKIMEKAPEMLGNLAAMKAGVAPQSQVLGSAVSNLSETKSEFVEYMETGITDEEVKYLGSICHFIKREDFKIEVANLIKKYHGQ